MDGEEIAMLHFLQNNCSEAISLKNQMRKKQRANEVLFFSMPALTKKPNYCSRDNSKSFEMSFLDLPEVSARRTIASLCFQLGACPLCALRFIGVAIPPSVWNQCRRDLDQKTCFCCLGVLPRLALDALSDATLAIVENKDESSFTGIISSTVKAADFEYDSFSLALILPGNIAFRDAGMFQALRKALPLEMKNFSLSGPGTGGILVKDPKEVASSVFVLNVKDVLRPLLQVALEKRLLVPYKAVVCCSVPTSLPVLSLNAFFTIEPFQTECAFLACVCR